MLIDNSLLSACPDAPVARVDASSPYFGIVRQHATTLDDPAIDHSVAVAHDLVSSLSSLLARSERSTSPRRVSKAEIDAFFRMNIPADLSALGVAAHFNLSRRTLFGLYQAANERFEQAIISFRLGRAMDLLLADDRLNQSVVSIAHMAGFKDIPVSRDAFVMRTDNRRHNGGKKS